MIIPDYIEVQNSSGNTTAYLSPKADGLKQCFPSCRLNGESTLTFYIPSTSEKLSEITPACMVVAGGREYSPLKKDAIDIIMDKKGTRWAKIMLHETWYLLDKDYPEPSINNDPGIENPSDLAVIIVSGGSDLSGGLYTPGSAEHALYALLDDTDWSLGTVDVTGTHDLETEKKSVLSNIKEVQKIWGGYLVWDSSNKTLSLRAESSWQNYTGFQIRYGKNLKSITRTQNNDIVTKLYPFGKDDLDIASVNGGVKYLEDTSHIGLTLVGIYRDENISDATELMTKGNEVLSKMSQERYTYRTGLVDLRTLSNYSHEDFDIGDMADVVHDDIGGSDQVRIIHHKYNLFQPWICELELDNPEDRLQDKMSTSFSTTGYVEDILNSKGEFSGNKLTDASLGTVKLVDLSVTTAKLADAATTTAKIANLAVDTGKLANLAVEAAKLAGSSVTSTKIANAAVGSAAIASAAIGSAHIGEAVILTAHVGDAQITDAKIDSVTANKITAGTIDTSVITISNLDADDVGETGSKKWAGETGADITSGHTANDTSNVSGVAAGTIAGWKYTGKTTIDGGQIETDTITATQINVAQLSAISADIGTVTTGALTSVTVTSSTIKTSSSGHNRIELTSGNVLKGLNSSNQLHGLYIDPGSYVDLKLYRAGSEFFTIYDDMLSVILQYEDTDRVVMDSTGGSLEGSWECSDLSDGSSDYATESWVSSNYVSDYSSQGIKLQYFSDHLEVSLNGSTWKTITYDS